MSRSVLLDSSGWIPLLNATEHNHKHALDIWTRLGQSGHRIVVTDWVIAETGNGLARSRAKPSFAHAIERIWQSPLVDVVIVDQPLIEQALVQYQGYIDKDWGARRLHEFRGDARTRHHTGLHQRSAL